MQASSTLRSFTGIRTAYRPILLTREKLQRVTSSGTFSNGIFLPTLSSFLRSCLSRTGMLDESIPGFDEWDLCVRIAEHYDVVALKEPIGIWRIATPSSEQLSSRPAKLWQIYARHQLKLFELPRAAANPERCRSVRRSTMAKISDRLICTWPPGSVRVLRDGHDTASLQRSK